jgi:predicted benzoate:H+ symporter BenE
VTFAAAAVLAKAAVNNNNVTPGVLGFFIVAGMGLALVLLLRSMNRQFRKIPPPPEEAGQAEAAKADHPAAARETDRRP